MLEALGLNILAALIYGNTAKLTIVTLSGLTPRSALQRDSSEGVSSWQGDSSLDTRRCASLGTDPLTQSVTASK
jgi:hypothetical protein